MFISSVLNLAIIVGIATVGFNYGVDFAGGTMVELKFHHSVSPRGAQARRRPACTTSRCSASAPRTTTTTCCAWAG
jgi:preprotein translocase subunit SecF